MSWNLLIYNESGDPLGDLASVTAKLDSTFRGLEWNSPLEAILPVARGFRLELRTEEDVVQDIYTDGGFDHIKQLAALCKREGWRIADAQEGEEVDLDEPQKWYDERSG
jgi:hypothetical protein